MYQIAVVGATGVVGQELLCLLHSRAFPFAQVRVFASSVSVGKTICFGNENLEVESLQETSFQAINLAFFFAGSTVSREFAPLAQHAGAFVIDGSSAFRKHSHIPLVIPEINPHCLDSSHRFVSSPNCAATLLLLPLAPLHRLYGVKRVVLSTYQAASGGGYRLMHRLKEETKEALENCHASLSYGFNLYPHDSPLSKEGYVAEEEKIRDETRIILEDPTIQVSATCIRVPILRAHSLSANIEFHRPYCLKEVREVIAQAPGVQLFEQIETNRFATPQDAVGREEVLCGRIRIDHSQPNTLELWIVGDQLLKGAALNALQIAEYAHTARLIK